MIDLEKTQRSLEVIQETITQVQHSANQDRKINGSKQIDGHYRKALEQLEVRRKIVQEHLDRALISVK